MFQFDTKGHNFRSTLNQFYRNQHAFIIMCDINKAESLKGTIDWIKEIEARASIQNCVIAVFANKCDKLDE